MLLTTTPTVEHHAISQYHGVVSAQAILGANVFRDFMAGIRNVLGGRSKAYEKALDSGLQQALEEISAKASQIGGNAVVGISVDYESLGGDGGMLMVCVTGTAVTVS